MNRRGSLTVKTILTYAARHGFEGTACKCGSLRSGGLSTKTMFGKPRPPLAASDERRRRRTAAKRPPDLLQEAGFSGTDVKPNRHLPRGLAWNRLE